MPIPSNYPPGVSGNEPEITGDWADRDYGYEAQQAAEKHLDAIATAMEYDEEHASDLLKWAENPHWPECAGPFCGCQTCVVREVLHVAWPIIEECIRNNPDGPATL